MDRKEPYYTPDSDEKNITAEVPVAPADQLEAVFIDGTIEARSRSGRLSSRERHALMRRRRKRTLIILSCVIAVLAIGGSVLWYLFCPLWGYGDLSENITADMMSKARSKFAVEQFFDSDEGAVLAYNIYIPHENDGIRHLPLMFAVEDAYSVGNDTKKPVNESFGGAVWATDLEQAKHPCFVVVPCYPEDTVSGGTGNISRWVGITERMIRSIVKKYGIDATRIYGTGQGMGASMMMYLTEDDPDLFDTMLIVDNGSVTADLSILLNSHFVCFAAGGDTAAVETQAKMKALLASSGIPYGELTDLDAEAPIAELNAAGREMLSLGCGQNFVTWRAGSVGWSLSGGEPRASFRYGYKIDAVRDWVFSGDTLTTE